MKFTGQEQDSGAITLHAQHPPGCWGRLVAAIQSAGRRVLFASLWFLLGLLTGWLWW
jgi:hypothetical protein